MQRGCFEAAARLAARLGPGITMPQRWRQRGDLKGRRSPLFKKKSPWPGYGQGRINYAVPPCSASRLQLALCGPRARAGNGALRPALLTVQAGDSGNSHPRRSPTGSQRPPALWRRDVSPFFPSKSLTGFILCGFFRFVKEKSAQTSQRSRNVPNIRSAYIFSGITVPPGLYQMTSLVMLAAYQASNSASLTSRPFSQQRSSTFSPSCSPQNRPS